MPVRRWFREYSQPDVMPWWKRIPGPDTMTPPFGGVGHQNAGASGSQEDRGVVAQAALALELGNLPGRMRIVADIRP